MHESALSGKLDSRWWEAGRQFWLFTLYSKDEMADLSTKEKAALKALLKHELENRQ